MPEYGRFCPVSLASEVLADRWTLLIVRELVLGNTRFNDIARGLPGISRSLLVQRLRHLERKRVVELWPSPTGKGHEYHLTAAGKDLEPVVDVVGRWAVAWLFDEPHKVVFGEETADAAGDRFAASVDALTDDGAAAERDTIVVAHGTVIALYVSRVAGIDPFPLWQSLGLPSYVVLSQGTRRQVEIVTGVE